MDRPRPNILYILADDMGYGDLSCLNAQSRIRTTHLDRIAREGMAFRDAHASSAVCTPSRYSILTGRYNWRSTLKQGVLWGYSCPLIEPGRMTVASFLKARGYRTACVGKWHLGWDWHRNGPGDEDVDFTRPITQGPLANGFDEYFGIAASLDMPPYVFIEGDQPTAVPARTTPGDTGKRMHRPGPIADDFIVEGVLDKLADRAVAFLEKRGADRDPFFLYFPLTAPHTPILPAPEYRGKSGTNAYGDFCLHVDAVVGRLLDALDRGGLAENTIVMFTSDNGCSPMADFDELAAVGHRPSHVFRGHKADIYEGGHRVPLVLRWPARVAAGGVCDETVCLSDLLATCADILGVTLPGDAGEDSVSNYPAWLGVPLERPLREATVHTSIDGSLSIRQGRWKLEMCPGSGGWSSPKPGKECEGLPPIQLYDLQSDIGERTNLADKFPSEVDLLKNLLTKYVTRGRSTPGPAGRNTGGDAWEQLWWMLAPRA